MWPLSVTISYLDKELMITSKAEPRRYAEGMQRPLPDSAWDVLKDGLSLHRMSHWIPRLGMHQQYPAHYHPLPLGSFLIFP